MGFYKFLPTLRKLMPNHAIIHSSNSFPITTKQHQPQRTRELQILMECNEIDWVHIDNNRHCFYAIQKYNLTGVPVSQGQQGAHLSTKSLSARHVEPVPGSIKQNTGLTITYRCTVFVDVCIGDVITVQCILIHRKSSVLKVNPVFTILRQKQLTFMDIAAFIVNGNPKSAFLIHRYNPRLLY